jgi:uncharacterized protein (TIGR03435 family)
MRISIAALIGASLSPFLVHSQSSDAVPAFEVVSVKPSTALGHYGIGIFPYPGGRVEASFCPVDYLIQQAFDIQPFQISGEPRWAREERFDLVGKPPESSPLSKSNPASFKSPLKREQRQMLYSALVDRFQLQYHWQTKEGEVYLLVRNGKKLNLQPSENKDDYPWAGAVAGGPPFSDGIKGINETMANLAERISPVLGRPVIDQTGIEGSFDFQFRYPGDEPNSDVTSVILTSMQGLGLKLEPSRGPVKILVIERVERPSAN